TGPGPGRPDPWSLRGRRRPRADAFAGSGDRPVSMKIGLLADTQGSFDIEALLAYVAKEFAGVDEIWHAGDWGSADVLEGLRRLGRLVVVNGNAPSPASWSGSRMSTWRCRPGRPPRTPGVS